MMMMEAGVRWRCSSVLVVAPPPRSLSSSFAQTTPAPLSRRTRRRRRIGNLCVRAVAAPTLSTTDESGRLCSPRAGRELALSIIYAACLQGSSDPLHLFQNRINAPTGGYEFDKSCLSQYDHMSFGGPPVTVHTLEEQEELLCRDNRQSSIEAEVLSAPPKLVYSKFILRLANKLVTAVTQRWDTNVVDIEKVVPLTWKNEPAGRILELCILHLAMSEIVVLKTRHQIVINEAVDLAKRFCDGAAPRIINGCLRTFVKDREEKT